MFGKINREIVFTLIMLTVFGAEAVFAQAQITDKEKNAIEQGTKILHNYFSESSGWHVMEPNLGKSVQSLVNFVQAPPIDSVLALLKKSQDDSVIYVYRLPEEVSDSLNVLGYIPYYEVQRNIRVITTNFKEEVERNPISVPSDVTESARKSAATIPVGKGMELFTRKIYSMPDSLVLPEVIPDSILNSTEAFNRLLKIDSMRNVFVEQTRVAYNDSIVAEAIKKASEEYRQQRFNELLAGRIKQYTDMVALNNYQVLRDYNNRVTAEVNDSIRAAIDLLAAYAEVVDTVRIKVLNLVGDEEEIFLQRGNPTFTRLWLKNEQNDSLGVTVKSLDKRVIQMLIDDGVTFHRFKEKQTKDFDFESLKKKVDDFTHVGHSYKLETPWVLGGNGSVGFTQTYLENWKKGGKSALSSLIVLKGYANYSSPNKKVKWENSAEIRNGWIKSGDGESELQKNDDKFELTSRYGLSAFKKWYYSAEFNFNTQLFRGYKYPKSNNPVPFSAFMAPSKMYFKIGLDYKPDKNLSLFLSPLTVKNVYVRDTSLIDQTKYGISENRKAFWEPGLNADLKYQHKFSPDLSFQTKYKMFINYKAPFTKFDIDWENLFQYQLNEYMNVRMMLHFIYDDDVKFPVYNGEGTKIGEEPRLQIKEFFTIGFAYKINHKVMRTRKIR